MACCVIPNVSETSPFFMMYGRNSFSLINTLPQPRPKYVGAQLHRQDLEQMHIVMHQVAKTLRKKNPERILWQKSKRKCF